MWRQTDGGRLEWSLFWSEQTVHMQLLLYVSLWHSTFSFPYKVQLSSQLFIGSLSTCVMWRFWRELSHKYSSVQTLLIAKIKNERFLNPPPAHTHTQYRRLGWCKVRPLTPFWRTPVKKRWTHLNLSSNIAKTLFKRSNSSSRWVVLRW